MLETQKQEQDEIEYNNPRNAMGDKRINTLKENLLNGYLSNDKESLQLPKLKFRWLWLLFGIPFFIDLYRYVKQLKQSCTDYQKNIEVYTQKIIQLQQKTTTQQELIDQCFDGQGIDTNMNNNIEELNFSKNEYDNNSISKENQIKELKVKLKYLNQLNKRKDKEIKGLETELHRCYKKLDAIKCQNYKRHILHKKGKYDEFLETKSTENINYRGMNGCIRNEDDTFGIKPMRADTVSDKNNFLI